MYHYKPHKILKHVGGGEEGVLCLVKMHQHVKFAAKLFIKHKHFFKESNQSHDSDSEITTQTETSNFIGNLQTARWLWLQKIQFRI